jgi:hypothetical protein
MHTQVWNGRSFDMTSLIWLGLVIPLGHNGARCTSRPRPDPSIIRVIAMNGVHNVKVAYCGCTQSLPRWKQLVRGDLFPATDKRCTTAVTFDLLECYMDLTHTAKVNVYKFYMGILRRSDRLGVAHNLVSELLML